MNNFTTYPLFLQGALVMIFLLLIALFITYIYIVFIRWRGSVHTRLLSKYENKFRELLILDIIANENLRASDYEESLNQFKNLHLDRKKVRRILIKNIRHFRKLFLGRTNELLRKLYIDLDLHRDAINGLQSRNSDIIIISIKELIVMGIQDHRLTTDTFLSHKNRYIRQITRHYIIAMEDDGIAKVFDNLTQPMSGIEQLELFETITSLAIPNHPDFSQWIRIENPHTLVSLCLKLVVHFQQFASIAVINRLLETESQQLKNEAINALGKLLQTESESILVSLYDEEKDDAKLEIIKALGRIASGKRINFLKYILDNEPSILLRKYAAKSIVSHDVIGSSFMMNMHERASPENQVVLSHALNSNIRY